MSCGRARRLLWPDNGPRSTSDEVVDAQEHLAECGACNEFVREMRAISGILHAGAPRDTAPLGVRDRLFKALARARTATGPVGHGGFPLAWRIAAGAVALVAGLLLLHGDRRPASSTALVAALAEDHARARGDARIRSADADEVARWLADELPFAIHVPSFPDARLRGARLCLTDARRGAVIEYAMGNTIVSYFLIPDDGDSTGSDQVVLHHASHAGFAIVYWREPGLLHAMVGDVSRTSLSQLARLCIEQARRTFAWWSLPS